MKRLAFLTGPVSKIASWSLVAAAASTLTGVITARSLAPDSRGTLALVVTMAGISVLIGALGSNVSIRAHLPRNSLVVVDDYVRVSRRLVWLVFIFLGAGLGIAVLFIDSSLGAVGVALGFVAYGVSYFLANQSLDLLNAQGKVGASAKFNAVGSLFCVLFAAVCWLIGGDLVYFVWAYVCSVLVQLLFTVRAIRGGISNRALGSRPGRRLLMLDGARSMGLNVGQYLAFSSGLLILGLLSTPSQVGLYAVAVTPAALLRIPSNAMGQLFFHESALNRLDRAKMLVNLGKLVMLMVPIAALGWLVAEPAILIVFGDEYIDAVAPFRVLLIAEIALLPFLVLGRILAGATRIKTASAAGIVGFLSLVLACISFIPTHGAVGAAWGSSFGYLAMSVTTFIGAMLMRTPRVARHSA